MAHQTPLSMEFSRQEYWNGYWVNHCFLQGTFLIQGLNPGLLHCRRILYHLSHQGSPWHSRGDWHFWLLMGEKKENMVSWKSNEVRSSQRKCSEKEGRIMLNTALSSLMSWEMILGFDDVEMLMGHFYCSFRDDNLIVIGLRGKGRRDEGLPWWSRD